MNEVMWEVKSPNTGNIKSIPAIIRHASKQSSWIVLDNRYTKLSDDKIIAKVQAILLLQRSIKKLIVITKSLEILLF